MIINKSRLLALIKRPKADGKTANRKPSKDRLLVQAIRYFTFGTLSVAVDFAVLNFALYVLHWPQIIANTLSMSVALAANYAINRKLVFRNSAAKGLRHYAYFLIVTLVGMYGLQNGILEILNSFPLAQSTIAGFISASIVHIPVTGLEANITKLLATTADGLWNFILLRKFVFVYSSKNT